MAKYFRILAIDGGGVRGIIPARILMSLETKLKKETGNPDIALGDCFDLIAGTSSGGILTCIYLYPQPDNPLRPLYNAEEALQFYFKSSNKIFRSSVWRRINSLGGVLDDKYPADGLETALEKVFHDQRLSHLIKPCLITAYDIGRREAYFFRQHDARRTPARDFLLRDVGRATSAAPTFFECVGIKSATQVHYPMIDGGVFANNPAMCAYAEALAMKEANTPTAKTMVILSLGTGDVRTPYRYHRAKNWGSMQWIRPLVDIMMSGVSETVDYQLRQIFAAVDASPQYLRIQTQIRPAHADPDNAESANLRTLKETGRILAEKNSTKLDAFARLLLTD
ncbi:MAG: patatin-like phospholipase family protein [Dehalococcoidia bacterium]|nr:patatin-like phospholipase family protein [Dehalococcoidia bacterium]